MTLDLESMDVNYGIQTFDSSIRWRDGGDFSICRQLTAAAVVVDTSIVA